MLQNKLGFKNKILQLRHGLQETVVYHRTSSILVYDTRRKQCMPLNQVSYDTIQRATFFFFDTSTTCFSLSSDHHQVFVATLMYALCLTSNVNLYFSVLHPLRGDHIKFLMIRATFFFFVTATQWMQCTKVYINITSQA
jgi:hypothetical protein